MQDVPRGEVLQRMRKKNFKGRCEKRMIGKCSDVCRTYDAIQYAYADLLQERVFVIDCINRKMPVWVEPELLESYVECTDGELFEVSSVDVIRDTDVLDADQRRVMHERYTMIAPIVSFVSDDKMRSKLICSIAEERKVSKQTVRNYLCLYLSYLDIAVLAPKKREYSQELTWDEKNIRWALNKFFYTTKKQSLMTAYTMMLKEKYCNAMGVLVNEYLNIKIETAERQQFHEHMLLMVREEMQSQGMKLVGALLAGIGTVNVEKIPEKSMMEEAGLPEECGSLPDELSGVLDFIR